MKRIFDKLEKGIIVTDREGYIYYGNTKLLKQLHKEASEIKGKHIGILLENIKVSGQDSVRYCTYLIKDTYKRQYVEVEVVASEWQGQKAYYYLFNEKPNELLEGILDELPVSIWLKDEDKRFCYVNSYFSKQADIYQNECDQIIGRINEELFDAEMLSIIEEGEEIAFREKKTAIFEKKINSQWYYFEMLPLKMLGEKVEYVLGIKYEVTMEKNRQKEREACKRKVEIEKIRNKFFANASHEFRTPINIILTSIQLLEDGKIEFKEDIYKYTSKIKQNGLRLLKLSNNIMDLTKIDLGHESLYLKNYNMVNVIEEITLSVVEYASNNGIEMIFDTEVEELIMAIDVEKIEKMMLNLLSNAVKFTPRDGKIKVNVFKENEKVVITVADTGIGIPHKECDTIFERFAQVDTSFTRRCEGTGMGLNIVKSIVDMYDGSINVSSILGEGSIFTVELPIHILEGKEVIEHLLLEEEERLRKYSVEFADIYNY